MQNIDILRKKIIKIKVDYLKDLKSKKVDISLSSLSSLRTLLFNNFCSSVDEFKNKSITSKINKVNFLYQLKSFLYISRFSNTKILGDLSKENIKKYNKIIIVWSKFDDFSKDGKYYNSYFHTSSEQEKSLWFLIHLGNKLPKKIKKNIIILNHKKTRFGINVFLLFKYFLKILFRKKFLLNRVYHELSFDSLVAHNVKKLFTKILSYINPKEIIFPYESQPFQNTLIRTVKKNKKKTILIGYDHSSNPFPIYNMYNFNSPDLLYVHSDASKFFYSKYFKWPSKKVKKIASLRIFKKKSSEFKNKIFLPYDFYNVDEITRNFKLLINFQKTIKIKPLKVSIHPARKNSKKHLKLKKKINEIIKNYTSNFSKKSGVSSSIHIGNTSTVIEALEANVPVTHIVSDPIFDLFSSKFWPSIKVENLSNNAFKYSIKKFGKCLIFKNKTSSFKKNHK
jgi:hypothetical protein